jgi:hypothetical protein
MENQTEEENQEIARWTMTAPHLANMSLPIDAAPKACWIFRAGFFEAWDLVAGARFHEKHKRTVRGPPASTLARPRMPNYSLRSSA